MLPGWRTDPSWNTCDLGPVRIPGIVTVTAEKGRDVDFKKSKGTDGGTLQDNGASQGKVTIDVVLPKESHWQQWQTIFPVIDPVKAGGIKQPLEIVHPEPNLRGIRNVYISMVRGLPPTALGGKRFQIECLEWFQQPKPTKAGKSVKPSNITRYNTGDPRAFQEQLSSQHELAPTGADAIANAFSKFN